VHLAVALLVRGTLLVDMTQERVPLEQCRISTWMGTIIMMPITTVLEEEVITAHLAPWSLRHTTPAPEVTVTVVRHLTTVVSW